MNKDIETQLLKIHPSTIPSCVPFHEQTYIELDDTQFDYFAATCNAQHTIPARLQQAANLLDQEGF